MAVNDLSFSTGVDAWVRETKARIEAVWKESTQRVVAEMQRPAEGGGNMPVDTGYLRASLLASTDAPPDVREDAVGEKKKDYKPLTDDEGLTGNVAVIISGAQIGQTIYVCYTAAYARRIEYGFSGEDSLGRVYNQAGRGFVRLAAQRWPLIVEEVVNDLKQLAWPQ